MWKKTYALIGLKEEFEEFKNNIYTIEFVYISANNTHLWRSVSFGEWRTLIGVGTDSNNKNQTFAINSTVGFYVHTHGVYSREFR